MDKRVNKKYRKDTEKYVYEYQKVKDKLQFRYELYKNINKEGKLVFYISTKIGKVTLKECKGEYIDFNDETSREEIIKYMNDNNIKNNYGKFTHKKQKKLFGIPTGKTKKLEDYNVAIIIPKNELNKEFVTKVLSTYDMQVGLFPKVDDETILKSFVEEHKEILEVEELFEKTIWDSVLFCQMYTAYDFN